MYQLSLKSGSLKLLEPSGPLQACNRMALPFTSLCYLVSVPKPRTDFLIWHLKISRNIFGHFRFPVYWSVTKNCVLNTVNGLRRIIRKVLPDFDEIRFGEKNSLKVVAHFRFSTVKFLRSWQFLSQSINFRFLCNSKLRSCVEEPPTFPYPEVD